jgi:hypothetical protein
MLLAVPAGGLVAGVEVDQFPCLRDRNTAAGVDVAAGQLCRLHPPWICHEDRGAFRRSRRSIVLEGAAADVVPLEETVPLPGLGVAADAASTSTHTRMLPGRRRAPPERA